MCWSQMASTRQHNKSLVSGTIGAFRLRSDKGLVGLDLQRAPPPPPPPNKWTTIPQDSCHPPFPVLSYFWRVTLLWYGYHTTVGGAGGASIPRERGDLSGQQQTSIGVAADVCAAARAGRAALSFFFLAFVDLDNCLVWDSNVRKTGASGTLQ